MEREDLKQFRRSKINLYSRIKLRNISPGVWESVYTGDGIDFASIKPFEPGDDLRNLNFSSLIQPGDEEVIERVVESQMKIYICADFSGSMQESKEMFFASKPNIRDIAIGLLIYSALNAYTAVGFCAFDSKVRRFITSRCGESCCEEILNWIINHKYEEIGVPRDFHRTISFLLRNVPSQSMIFFISDFKDHVFEGDFTKILRPAIKKFDFIPVIITDPLEKAASIKRPITVSVKNDEGTGSGEIYLTLQKMKHLQEICASHLFNIEQNFHKMGTDYVILDSPLIQDCYQSLLNFFEIRKRIRV